jgi:type III restriction enzyme
MPLLTQGRVLVTNWHVFEPQSIQTGGVGARVNKAGVEVRTKETITIGSKTTTARGTRYLTLEDFERQVAAGMLTVIDEERETDGTLKKVSVDRGAMSRATRLWSIAFLGVKWGASRISL